MLLADYGRSATHLLGGLDGKADVENLQRALINLAQATGRPAINPGGVTGVVDSGTVSAVTAALGLLTEELPSWLYLTLQGGLILGSTTAQATKLVEQYATQLTIAANTAAVKFKAPQTGGKTMTFMPNAILVNQHATPSSGIPSGWYKTWWGIALIAIGAFGAYKIFLAPPPKAA